MVPSILVPVADLVALDDVDHGVVGREFVVFVGIHHRVAGGDGHGEEEHQAQADAGVCGGEEVRARKHPRHRNDAESNCRVARPPKRLRRR